MIWLLRSLGAVKVGNMRAIENSRLKRRFYM